MSSRAPPDWVAIRRAYEETDAPVASICVAHAIDRKALSNAARRHGWRRKHPRPFPAGRLRVPDAPGQSVGPILSIPASPTGPSPDAASPPPAQIPSTTPNAAPPSPDRRRLLDRLVAAISLKLEQLERRMQDDLGLIERGEAPTSTDHEKETRAIGALIDNLGKITEIEGGLDRHGPAGKSADASGIADDAERWRRELAERLARIVEASPRAP